MRETPGCAYHCGGDQWILPGRSKSRESGLRFFRPNGYPEGHFSYIRTITRVKGPSVTTKIRLAHSPDADDAFMFYGLAKNKLDTQGIEYEHILKDIQTLNEWAREGRMEVTAISVHAYAYVKDKYAILTHGGSIGKNYGPMIIAKGPVTMDSLKGKRIAIPGKLTSAYLALKLCFPDFQEVLVNFDQIMDEVDKGTVDAGLIIHEGQLTYKEKGLHKIVDLGEWWFEKMGMVLPMGVNAI